MYVRQNVTDITIPIKAYQSSLPSGSDLLSLNKEFFNGLISQAMYVVVDYTPDDDLFAGLRSIDQNGPVLIKPFSGGYLEAELRFTQGLEDGASVMRLYCDGQQVLEYVDPTPEQGANRVWAYFRHNQLSWGTAGRYWQSAASARIGKITCRGAKRDWLKFERALEETGYGPNANDYTAYAWYQRAGDVVTDVFGLFGTRWDGDQRLDGLLDIDDDGYIYVKEYDDLAPMYKEGGIVDGWVKWQLDGSLQLRMRGTTANGDGPHAIIDRAGRTKKAYADGGSIMFRRIEYFHDAASWSAPVALYTGSAPAAPCLMACEDGTLACWYMDGGVQRASKSSDDGRTWTELTNMLGTGLTNVATINVRGTTYGVGVRDNQAYLVRSNDNGQTQTPFPSGAMEILVGTVGYDVRCCLTYEDTGEMVCWAQDDDGDRVEFYSRSSGYTTWTRRV